MLFVKPEAGLPGYFVLFDEIAALNPQFQIHMHLHPNSNNFPVIRDDGQVYKWVIKRCNTNKDVRVMICLGNDPVSSEIKDGYLASYDQCSRIVGKYLLTNFQPDSSGKKSITTLIYPYLGDQNLPSFNRIEVENCSGTAFKFNDEVSDYTFTSESPEEVIYRDVSYIANAVYMRMVNDDVLNYITRKGTRMLYQGNRVFGFESEKPVTIVCTGKTGNIISDSTNIIVYYPEIDYIILDSLVAEVLKEGGGWKKIFVPKGNHHFQLESPVSVTIQESDITTGERFLPGKQDEALSILNYPNPFSVSTTVKFPNPSGKPYQMHLFDLSGKVVRMKADITVNEFLLMRDGLEEGMYMIELNGEMVYRGKLLIK